MSDQDREREGEPGTSGTGPDDGPRRSAKGDPTVDAGGGGEGARADPGASGPEGEGPEQAGTAEEGARTPGWSGAISQMQNLVGDVVGEVLEGVRDATGRGFPRLDMIRTGEGGYAVRVDLPGIDRDSVRVTTLGGELTIAGERPRPELPEESEVLRTERGYGSFRRTLRLPPDVREDQVSARLEDGVLEVRLPRKAPSEARTVDIE